MNISAEQHFSSQPGSSQTRRAEMRGGMSRFLEKTFLGHKKTPIARGSLKNTGRGPKGPRSVNRAYARSHDVLSVTHLISALAVVLCVISAVPSSVLADDSQPTAQAEAINGEFLANLPAPTGSKAICIVDTGVSLNEDLQDSVVGRYAVDGGSVEDLGSAQHGTRVTMAAVGKASNGWGSAGIWPAGQLISVRGTSVDDPDHFSWTGYSDGIDKCNYGAAVQGVELAAVSLSLGGPTSTDSDSDELAGRISREQAADRYDTSVIAAAGNDSASEVSYPARFEGVFGVGATSASGGAFCDFSNRGEGLDISAPGCDTDGSDTNGNAEDWRGTSFSAPITAAVLAALRSYRQDLSAVEAEQLLLDTAQTTSAGKVVDADAAFRAAGLGTYVDTYTPPPTTSSGDANPTADTSTSSGETSTASSSESQTTIVQSYVYNAGMEYEESWGTPRISAEWRTKRGTQVIVLSNVPSGAKLETVNDQVEKTFKLRKRRVIVKVKQDKWSRMPIRLRYVGKGKNPSDRTSVGGYYPLPGRCMENVLEQACFTATGRPRKVTKRDARAINRAQKRYRAHEKRLRELIDSLHPA